jgi:hypothetical protein
MSSKVLNVAVAILAITSAPVLAHGYDLGRPLRVQPHRYAAPPSIAARSALPACGFAAIESWGPNGFQYCDPRNVHGAEW